MAVNNANLKKIPLASDLNLNDFENEINKFTTYKHNNSKYYGGVLSNWYKKKEGTREFVGYDKKGHLWETSSSHRDLYRDNQYIGDFQDVTAKLEEYDIQDEIDELGINFNANEHDFCFIQKAENYIIGSVDYYVILNYEKNPTEINCLLVSRDTSSETPVVTDIGTYTYTVNQCDIAEYNCLSTFGYRVIAKSGYVLISVYPVGSNIDEHLFFSTRDYISPNVFVDNVCPIPEKTKCINLSNGEEVEDIYFRLHSDLFGGIPLGYSYSENQYSSYDNSEHPIGDNIFIKESYTRYRLQDCIIVNNYIFCKYTTSFKGAEYLRPIVFILNINNLFTNGTQSTYDTYSDFHYLSDFGLDKKLQQVIGSGVAYHNSSIETSVLYEYPADIEQDGIVMKDDVFITVRNGSSSVHGKTMKLASDRNMSYGDVTNRCLGIIDHTFIDWKITTNTQQFKLFSGNYATHFIGVFVYFAGQISTSWYSFYESNKDERSFTNDYTLESDNETYRNIDKYFITNRFDETDVSDAFELLKDWESFNHPELNFEFTLGDNDTQGGFDTSSAKMLGYLYIRNVSGETNKYVLNSEYYDISTVGRVRAVSTSTSETPEIAEGREFRFDIKYGNNSIPLLMQYNNELLQSISIGQNVITRDIEDIFCFGRDYILYYDRNKNKKYKLQISTELKKPVMIDDFIVFSGANVTDGLNAIKMSTLDRFNYCMTFNNRTPLFFNLAHATYINIPADVELKDYIPNMFAEFLGYDYTLTGPYESSTEIVGMRYYFNESLTFQSGYIVSAINENYEKDYLWYGSSQYSPITIKCCNVDENYMKSVINSISNYSDFYKNGLVNFYNSFDGGVVAYWFSMPIDDMSLRSLVSYSYPIANSGDILYTMGFLDVFLKNKFPYVFINDGEENYRLFYNQTMNTVIFLYNLLSQNVNGLFCLQGMYFGYSDEYIYPISYEDGVINQGEAIINITGLQYIESTPTTALFWSPKNKTMYFFTGSNQFSDYYQTNKINKIVAVSYIDSTGDIFICTDNCGIIVYNHDQSLIDLDIAAKEVGSVNDDIYIVSEDIGVDRYSENYKSDYERQKIKIETEYFGEEDFLDSEFDAVYLKIAGSNYYSDEDYNGEVSVECSLLTQFSKKSEKKVFKFSKRDFDKDTNTLLIRYQPQYQRGIGLSVKVVSDFPISSFYINSTPVCVSNSNNNG